MPVLNGNTKEFNCRRCNRNFGANMFGRHSQGKDTLRTECKECRRSLENARYRQNPERRMALSRLHYHANKAAHSSSSRIWALRNVEKVREIKQDYERRNRVKIIAAKAANVAKRKRRTVSWANEGVIREFYARSLDISRVTGVRHHVDHILPLCGKLVSGLHNEFNLQILPAAQNCSKKASFIP